MAHGPCLAVRRIGRDSLYRCLTLYQRSDIVDGGERREDDAPVRAPEMGSARKYALLVAINPSSAREYASLASITRSSNLPQRSRCCRLTLRSAQAESYVSYSTSRAAEGDLAQAIQLTLYEVASTLLRVLALHIGGQRQPCRRKVYRVNRVRLAKPLSK
jgi:hypothetical protein